MTLTEIFFAVFILASIANAVALVRYWQALRAFKIVLANLETTQRQFNELYAAQEQKRPPRPEPSVPFRKT